MEIKIKNCNNLDSAEIIVAENELNIKYGINGVGKSTIARAIQLKIDSEDLSALKGFGKPTLPSVSFIPNIGSKNVAVFNENYVDNYVFIEDNVHKNVFEVFIKPKDYNVKVKEISSILSDVKNAVTDENIIALINKIDKVRKFFPVNHDGAIPGTSSGLKTLKEGNRADESFKTKETEPFWELFIGKSEIFDEWVSWVKQGRKFNNDRGVCQYCGQKLPDYFAEASNQIDALFDEKNIKKRAEIKTAIKELDEFIDDTVLGDIDKIISSKDGITKDGDEKIKLEAFLIQLYAIFDGIKKINDIDIHVLLTSEKPHEYLMELKIKIPTNILKKSKTLKLFEGINIKANEFEDVKTNVARAIGELNGSIRESTNKAREQINNFLKLAGISYEVNVCNEKLKTATMTLSHIPSNEPVAKTKETLSFGERNAFALVLFMLEALSRNVDLVILDDPVSSFDDTKKYAIMYELFRNNHRNFYGYTVLMFTHDLSPIIDFIKNKKPTGNNNNATYLVSDCCNVTESEIKRSDILCVFEVANKNVADISLDVICRTVYLRRLFELNNNFSNGYDILCSILKNKDKPCHKDGTPLDDMECKVGLSEIIKKIDNFDYGKILIKIRKKPDLLTRYKAETSKYIKLQIARVMMYVLRSEGLDSHASSVLMKYIQEAYHIENNLLFQLDPNSYEMIPDYIINACDEWVKQNEPSFVIKELTKKE